MELTRAVWVETGHRATGSRRRAAGLAAGTLLVFLLSALVSWRARAQCFTPTGRDCYSGGYNPCPYTSCAPTGTGYTCLMGTVWVTEGFYSLTNPPPIWYRCFASGGSVGTCTCSESYINCGTITNYGTGWSQCYVLNQCSSGTWTWTGCQATSPNTSCTGCPS